MYILDEQNSKNKMLVRWQDVCQVKLRWFHKLIVYVRFLGLILNLMFTDNVLMKKGKEKEEAL